MYLAIGLAKVSKTVDALGSGVQKNLATHAGDDSSTLGAQPHG